MLLSIPTKPRVLARTNASPDEVTQRHHRLKTMSSKDLEDVDIMVTTQWNKERSGLPQSMQAMLPVEPTQKYWEQNYYPCLDKVYTKKVPRVDPKHNATAELVESRRMLFDSLSVENIHILDEAVQKLWDAERNALPQPLRIELPPEPPDQYWADHYYQTTSKLFPQRFRGSIQLRTHPRRKLNFGKGRCQK